MVIQVTQMLEAVEGKYFISLVASVSPFRPFFELLLRTAAFVQSMIDGEIV